MEEEQKQEVNEVKEEVVDQVNDAQPEVKEDRPEANYKAELDRKNREIERLRQEVLSRQQEPQKRDPNDIATWSDNELKAIINSADPTVLPYKEKANDVLLDRKVDARLARQADTHKRVSADLELKESFPDALDPASSLSLKMDELTSKYDLSKTPAGRLVAAKLAANELNQGKGASDARGRKNEKDRVASVRSNMVDGDRPKPTSDSTNLDTKRKELADNLMDSKHEDKQVEAVAQALKDRGFTREKFFGR